MQGGLNCAAKLFIAAPLTCWRVPLCVQSLSPRILPIFLLFILFPVKSLCIGSLIRRCRRPTGPLFSSEDFYPIFFILRVLSSPLFVERDVGRSPSPYFFRQSFTPRDPHVPLVSFCTLFFASPLSVLSFFSTFSSQSFFFPSLTGTCNTLWKAQSVSGFRVVSRTLSLSTCMSSIACRFAPALFFFFQIFFSGRHVGETLQAFFSFCLSPFQAQFFCGGQNFPHFSLRPSFFFLIP